MAVTWQLANSSLPAGIAFFFLLRLLLLLAPSSSPFVFFVFLLADASWPPSLFIPLLSLSCTCTPSARSGLLGSFARSLFGSPPLCFCNQIL
jgi:hypothetical protein